MHRTPDISELRALFNGAHTALDPQAPEEYSPHRFEHQQNDERVVCEIYTACGELRFIWWNKQRLLMDLLLEGVTSLDISRSGDTVSLVGNAEHHDFRQMFKLQIAPQVCWRLSSALTHGD